MEALGFHCSVIPSDVPASQVSLAQTKFLATTVHKGCLNPAARHTV